MVSYCQYVEQRESERVKGETKKGSEHEESSLSFQTQKSEKEAESQCRWKDLQYEDQRKESHELIHTHPSGLILHKTGLRIGLETGLRIGFQDEET